MATLFTSFGLFALAVLILGVLLLKTDRAIAVSGPLIGFGAAWLLWLWRQSLSGGTTEGATGSAIVFGLLPVGVGLALVTPLMVGWLKGALLPDR